MLKHISLGLGLVVITLAVFGQVMSADFINIDDDKTVYANPYMRQGLNLQTVKSVFSGGPFYDYVHGQTEWIPVTVISRLIDIELFGLNPGGHHAMNLLVHILNVLILFCLLKIITGAWWKSAIVAVLFAIHPIQVEPVSWVTSRKDVLSAFFGLWTIMFYVISLRRPFWGKDALIAFLFVLSVLAKPTMVMLPVVLMLLDYWPLGIWNRLHGSRGLIRAVSNKWPLWLISIIMGVFTLGVRGYTLVEMSLLERLMRMPIVLLFYLGKIVFPTQLHIYGPFWNESVPIGAFILSGLVVTGLTAVFCYFLRRYPFLLIGWVWYMACLAPVLMVRDPADRYQYFPMIGLMILFVWGLARLTRIAITAGIGIIMICAGLSFGQAGIWRNNITLYEHMLRFLPDNSATHNNLGVALADAGRNAEAQFHYRKAIYSNRDYPDAYLNWGALLHNQGKYAEAQQLYREVLRLDPAYAEAYFNLGLIEHDLGNYEQALEYYANALRAQPHLQLADKAMTIIHSTLAE